MLLAQINRDSQGMAEFHDADGQPVTLCLTEAVTVAGELTNWQNYFVFTQRVEVIRVYLRQLLLIPCRQM